MIAPHELGPEKKPQGSQDKAWAKAVGSNDLVGNRQRGGVKGTRVTLLFPYLHRPARQGEVFASLFVKLPTTGAASAESYDLYS
jgi:hypothetical protein